MTRTKSRKCAFRVTSTHFFFNLSLPPIHLPLLYLTQPKRALPRMTACGGREKGEAEWGGRMSEGVDIYVVDYVNKKKELAKQRP